MGRVVVASLRMAALTEADGVRKRIRTAVGLLNDVVNVGGAASKLMADTAVPSRPYKCLDADGVGERHTSGSLVRPNVRSHRRAADDICTA